MNKAVNPSLLVVSVLLMACWFGWQEVKKQSAHWLPIKYVRIEGAFQYIAKENVKKVLRSQVVNGLYNADLQQIRTSVLHLPWVENVSVKRVWPDAINIIIEEQKPFVRWGGNGLLNKNGELFMPENIEQFSALPLLAGPEGLEKKLLEVYKGIVVALQDQGLALAEFHVNKRRAWRIRLQNDVELMLGRNEPLNKFQRFLKTLSLLGDEQVNKMAVVDVRYPNGYALTWKNGEEKVDWKKIAEMKKI